MVVVVMMMMMMMAMIVMSTCPLPLLLPRHLPRNSHCFATYRHIDAAAAAAAF
jgi:hypothetical protein